MNQPERILRSLEPPTGGLKRLQLRRDFARRRNTAWWSLASGGATAMAVAWLTVASKYSGIQMPLTGGRLIGERSLGPELQILDNGRALLVPSADANVRIFVVEFANPTAAKAK